MVVVTIQAILLSIAFISLQ
ncbi:MAG: hypothetical protein LBQ24_01960 [Candidatus Peribacteria bacterium]|nr:hypothetical protein [Candidatus Peribacteria bacterium]